jgi:hypothetical protein
MAARVSPGSARVTRAGFGVAPKRTFAGVSLIGEGALKETVDQLVFSHNRARRVCLSLAILERRLVETAHGRPGFSHGEVTCETK